MKDIKYFLTVEEYKNSNLSIASKEEIDYENVSFTEDDDNIWIREYKIPGILTLKYHVDSETSGDSSRLMSNNYSIFESLDIEGYKSINMDEYKTTSTLKVNKNNFFAITDDDDSYVPNTFITEPKVEIVIKTNRKITENDYFCIFVDSTSNSYGITFNLFKMDGNFEIKNIIEKINDTTFKIKNNFLIELYGHPYLSFCFIENNDKIKDYFSGKCFKYESLDYVIDTIIEVPTMPYKEEILNINFEQTLIDDCVYYIQKNYISGYCTNITLKLDRPINENDVCFIYIYDSINNEYFTIPNSYDMMNDLFVKIDDTTYQMLTDMLDIINHMYIKNNIFINFVFIENKNGIFDNIGDEAPFALTEEQYNCVIKSVSIIGQDCTEDVLLPNNNGTYTVKAKLKEGITSFKNSFFNIENLTYIEIPDIITSFSELDFYLCTSLSDIIFPKELYTIKGLNLSYTEWYNNFKGNEIIINNVFFYELINKNVSTYTVSNDIKLINDWAFNNCNNLTIINIPNSVTEIGNYVFYGCSSLSSIEIPSSVTSIGNSVFSGCSSLSSVTIPSSVTSIGDEVFYDCDSLSSITIPSGVTSIGSYAFNSCDSLSSITIPNGVTSIGDYTFGGCSSLSSITIPSGVTSISDGAFSSCSSLSSITFEEDSQLTSIGDYTFAYCSSLSSITIPNGVTSIGDGAFYSCYLLSSIEIPSGVTSIGSSTFSNCSSLSSIEIPSGVTSIGDYAFYSCSSLSEIICLAEMPPIITENSFSDILDLGVVYYPGTQNYDSWKPYFPSGWDFVQLYIPQECTNLVISAEDVNGKATSTTISYTATTNGVDNNGNVVTNIIITGTSVSAPFEQNTDLNNVITRTITFEYLGATASTTITQGVWFNQYYSLDLNNQWQLSSRISNPDSNTYDGVYESFSNKDIDNSSAICIITINGYENFKFYVRSYAESSYDFVVVSNLDCELSSGTTSGDSVKMTTSGNQNSGTDIESYTLVEFSGIDGGEHTIQVMYRKDGSSEDGDDRGYLLIPKEQ